MRKSASSAMLAAMNDDETRTTTVSQNQKAAPPQVANPEDLEWSVVALLVRLAADQQQKCGELVRHSFSRSENLQFVVSRGWTALRSARAQEDHLRKERKEKLAKDARDKALAKALAKAAGVFVPDSEYVSLQSVVVTMV